MIILNPSNPESIQGIVFLDANSSSTSATIYGAGVITGTFGPAPIFLTAEPSSLNVTEGNSVSSVLTVKGQSVPVEFTFSNMPDGATYELRSDAINTGHRQVQLTP